MKTNSKGYLLQRLPNHPFSNSDGYVAAHRVVMERIIGRYINPREFDVHHKDGDVKNNDPINLQLLTKSEHRRVHAGWKYDGKKWSKPCKDCKEMFEAEPKNFYIQKRTRQKDTLDVRCKKCSSRYTIKMRRK